MSDTKINREYKDRLFCLLFGKEEYKENILSLYNALNDTSYTDINDIEITTISDAIYVGMKNDEPAVVKLKLSDAFYYEDDSGEFQWTATMINLNKGKNDHLLAKCKVLSDYMYLIDLIRKYQKLIPIKDAVDKAVIECIENDVLAEFLIKHRAEVLDVCITEFNEKVFVNGIHQEGYEEGVRDHQLQIVKNMLSMSKNEEEIALVLGLSSDEVMQLIETARQ